MSPSEKSFMNIIMLLVFGSPALYDYCCMITATHVYPMVIKEYAAMIQDRMWLNVVL